ncbi:MAG: hypothetical protein NT027_16355 [Proteobacteria bacterium]|nr:hypothetical protein [Pseudomonadota bacterium]
MMIKLLPLVSLFVTTIAIHACGGDLDGRQFRQEKTNRIDAEQRLYAQETKLKIVSELGRNFNQTNTYQWTYYTSSVGDPIGTYQLADEMCQQIGFGLPTEEQLLAEGVQVKTIKALGSLFELDGKVDFKAHVYIKDINSQTLRSLVCVRAIPSK